MIKAISVSDSFVCVYVCSEDAFIDIRPVVTIQEQGWESFSEDETPAPSKPSQTSSASSSQAAKPKKAAAKGSQGSIMSFFSKK